MGRGPTEKYHQQLHPLFAKGSLTCLSADTMERKISNESPLTLNIEPTNKCNLRCDYCPGEKARAIFGPYDLGADQIPGILGSMPWIKDRLLWVNFHKDGEPLMNPELSKMIRYVKNMAPHTVTHLNTNGLILTPSRGQELLASGLDDITISLDAAWSETYNKRKGIVGASPIFGTIEKNASVFCVNCQSTPATSRVKMIEFADTTPKEIEDFYKKWHNVADQVQITGAHDWSGGVESTEITDVKKPERHACPLLWYTLAINADKTVSICNVDWNRTGVLGDLSTESLYNIWQGARLKEIRRMHLYGYFDSPRMPSVCKDCVVWAGCDNMDGFFKEKTSML